MANKSALSGAMVDANGDQADNAREQVVAVVAEAKKKFPKGPPADSPFAQIPRDRLATLANTSRLAALHGLLTDDELRTVLHADWAEKQAADKAAPPARPEQPAVPSLPDRPPIKFRNGEKTSPIGVYRVRTAKSCSLPGQGIFWVAKGAPIREADFMVGQVQLLIDGGLELDPVMRTEDL